MVPRRRREGRSRARRSPTRSASPTSTCCACRRSPTTSRIRCSAAARAKTSSRCSPSLLPGYTAIAGVAVDQPGRRRHAAALRQHDPVAPAGAAGVPPPAALSRRSRRAEHAARRGRGGRARAPFGDVRVITTHLEYYSQRKRSAQVEALRAIYAEGHALRREPARRRCRTKDRTIAQPRPAAHRHHRRLQPRARRSAARPDGSAVRRRHAAAVRRVGDRASGQAAPATFKIYEKERPASPSCTATSSS